MGRNAASVQVEMGAQLSKLDSDLSQAKQKVRSAVDDMNKMAQLKPGYAAATSTSSVARAADVQSGQDLEARILRNIDSRAKRLERSATSRAIEERERWGSVATYQQRTGNTIRDAEQRKFERLMAVERQRQVERQWNYAMAPRDIDMGDIQEAARLEDRAGRKIAAKDAKAAMANRMSERAKLGGAIASIAAEDVSLAAFIANKDANVGIAGERARQSALERTAFMGRNANNDPVLGGFAAGEGRIAAARASTMGWAIEKLPVIGDRVTASFERITHAVDKSVSAYQYATASILQSSIAREQMAGTPIAALRREQSQDIKDATEKYQNARDAYAELRKSGKATPEQINAAKKAMHDADISVLGKSATSEMRERIATEQRTAELTSIRWRGGLAMAAGTATEMEIGGYATEAFGRRQAIDERTLRMRQMNELAGTRGQMRAELETTHIRELKQFDSDRRARARVFVAEQPEAMAVESDGSWKQVGRMRQRQYDQIDRAFKQGLPDFGTVRPEDQSPTLQVLNDIKDLIWKAIGSPSLPGLNAKE